MTDAPPPPTPVFGDPRAVRDWAAAWRGELMPFLTGGPDRPAGDPPRVCVAVERFPEEWPPTRVRALLAAFPLSAWVVACGPWAASGGRTGSPWPVAVRYDWAESRRRVSAAVRGEPVPGVTDGAEAGALR